MFFSFKLLVALFALFAVAFAQITVPNRENLAKFVEDIVFDEATDVPGVSDAEALLQQLGKR